MERLPLHSPDLTAQNIEKLAALFPNCVVEAKDDKGQLTRKIDFDELRQELSDRIVEGPQERYRLDWPGKREALLTANAPIAKTLRPCREESVDFDTTKNLFIEGDNLDALKLLQETYLGKVKMIYIDPPYNTGKQFIYNDDFAINSSDYLLKTNQTDDSKNRLTLNTETNGQFHSDWLSMMLSRLRISRNILSESGLAFISIDNSEISNLIKLCNEVFGESNFVGTLVLQTATDNNPTLINTEHEYIVCYAKSISVLDRWTAPSEPAKLIQEEYIRIKTEIGNKPEEIQKRLRTWINENLDKLPRVSHYDNVDERGVFHDGDIANTRFGGYNYVVLHPKTGKPCKIPEKGFRFPDYTLNEMLRKGDILFGEDETTLIKPKKRLENVKEMLRSIIYEDGRASTKMVDDLLGRSVFDNPKSPTVLTKLLQFVSSNKDSGDIFLDFFSGSSTTAHAVMQLNAEDGGNRRFIMVQLPEVCDEKSEAYKAGYKTIAEIGKERIRRAGKKIKEENATNCPNLDIGFRVLKVDTSNAKDIYYTPDKLNQSELALSVDNIKEDRTSEDLLFQVMLDWGIDLSLPVVKETIQGKQTFFVDGNAIAASFEGNIDEDFVKELAKCKPLRAVFRDNGFASDSVKINVEQIFKLLSPTTEVKTL